MNKPSTPLVIYTGDPTSVEVLPAAYLALPGVKVLTGDQFRPCTRCGREWGHHSWLVTPGSSLDVIDCSVTPRDTGPDPQTFAA